MSKVIIFGIRDFANLAYHYLSQSSEHQVVAFSVTRKFLPADPTFKGLPIIPFGEVEQQFPPNGHLFFAPMSHRNLNRDRESIFKAIAGKGYEFISYIHPSTTVSKQAEVGKNCMILESNTLQPFVEVEDNVIIWGDNFIAHHSTISQSVFIACNVTVGGHCSIGERSFLGNSCSIRDQLIISKDTTIGMGANVVKETEVGLTYTGNPARAVD